MKSWIIPVLDLFFFFFFYGKDISILRKENKVYNGPGLRALASKNAILFFFTISKSNFIAYTIPFYNSTHIKKLYFY